MRRIISLFLFVAALLVVSPFAVKAQTTYTQTNHVCLLYQCKDATFEPEALLSYQLPEVFNQLNQGKTDIAFTNQYAQWCTGSFSCFQASYKDFNGTLVRKTRANDPTCPISDACWYLNGTFNSGQETVAKKFECFARGCTSGADDTSGTVTASGSSVQLKPGVIILSGRANLCTDDGKVWWRIRQDGMCHAADSPRRQ